MSTIGAVVNLAGSIAATYWLGPVGPAIGSLPVVLVLDFIVLPIVGLPVPRRIRPALRPVRPGPRWFRWRRWRVWWHWP